MVYRTGLENRSPCKRTVGSNPTPSAPTPCGPALQAAFRRPGRLSTPFLASVNVGRRNRRRGEMVFPGLSPEGRLGD